MRQERYLSHAPGSQSREIILTIEDAAKKPPATRIVRHRLRSHEETNAVSPATQKVMLNRFSTPGRYCLGPIRSGRVTVPIPRQLPPQIDSANTAAPSPVTTAETSTIVQRRTGSVASRSMVPRLISPLTTSEPRPTAQPRHTSTVTTCT